MAQLGAFMMGAGIILLACLAIARRPTAAARPPGCLDRVIDEARLPMGSLQQALGSLEQSAGVRLEVLPAEMLGNFRDYPSLLAARRREEVMVLRRVTVRQALVTILGRFGISRDVQYCVQGDLVRVKAAGVLADRPEAGGPVGAGGGEAKFVRAYDVRALVEAGRRFSREFEERIAREQGAVEAMNAYQARYKRSRGLFIEALLPPDPAAQLYSLVWLAGAEEYHLFGGWLILSGTAAQQDRAQRILSLLREMR